MSRQDIILEARDLARQLIRKYDELYDELTEEEMIEVLVQVYDVEVFIFEIIIIIVVVRLLFAEKFGKLHGILRKQQRPTPNAGRCLSFCDIAMRNDHFAFIACGDMIARPRIRSSARLS